jgi:hypothetical protein
MTTLNALMKKLVAKSNQGVSAPPMHPRLPRPTPQSIEARHLALAAQSRKKTCCF